ncbi:hypothetical protein GCM10029992_36330 [Glycomyces albus]
MDTRATPFGLFAGLAPIHFTETPVVEFGTAHKAVARLDATVLHQILTKFEDNLLPNLPVVVNNLAAVQGGRLTLLSQTERDDTGPAEIAIRCTPRSRRSCDWPNTQSGVPIWPPNSQPNSHKLRLPRSSPTCRPWSPRVCSSPRFASR